MSNVAEIQAAVERLPAAERLELFRWLAEREDIVAQRRAELLVEIDLGLEEADRGELLSGEAVIKHLKTRAHHAA